LNHLASPQREVGPRDLREAQDTCMVEAEVAVLIEDLEKGLLILKSRCPTNHQTPKHP